MVASLPPVPVTLATVRASAETKNFKPTTMRNPPTPDRARSAATASKMGVAYVASGEKSSAAAGETRFPASNNTGPTGVIAARTLCRAFPLPLHC
jgi:hypothetical protein